MVPAMQRGRDAHAPRTALEPQREIDVPMLEQIGDREDNLEEDDRFGRSANEGHRGEANGKREEEFSRVEADPRGRREGRVRMMHLVEAPEEWNAVVGPMPAVRDEIESNDGGRDGERPWHGQGIQRAESGLRGPAGDSAGARSAHDPDDDEVDEPEGAIHPQTTS